MKRSFLTLATFTMLTATNAYADNATIEDALKSRPDLSNFYQALVTTGVIHEIGSGPYTIFAPTNEAFAKIDESEYPCFYSPQCRGEFANLLRSHIVRGTENLSDDTKIKGSLVAINDRNVNIGSYSSDSRRPNADLGNDYTVDGHLVLSESEVGAASLLYKIDGVIASPREMVAFEEPVDKTTVTERVYYSPNGRPDGDDQTTVTRTIINAAPAR